MSWLQNEKNRAVIYRVLAWVAAIGILAGFWTETEAVPWLEKGAEALTLLGLILASRHTSL